MTEPHEHVWTSVDIVRITEIDNPDYRGVAGDRAFLVWVCDCDVTYAFNYGPYQLMKEKMKEAAKVLKERIERKAIRETDEQAADTIEHTNGAIRI